MAGINFREFSFTEDFSVIIFANVTSAKISQESNFSFALRKSFYLVVLRMILEEIDTVLLKQMIEIIDGFENT